MKPTNMSKDTYKYAKGSQAILHLKIGDFEFIEAPIDLDWEQLISDAKHIQLMNLPQEGISKKEFDRISETLLLEGPLYSEDRELYLKMSPEQQSHLQWAKRTLARIKSREETPVIEKES